MAFAGRLLEAAGGWWLEHTVVPWWQLPLAHPQVALDLSKLQTYRPQEVIDLQRLDSGRGLVIPLGLIAMLSSLLMANGVLGIRGIQWHLSQSNYHLWCIVIKCQLKQVS